MLDSKVRSSILFASVFLITFLITSITLPVFSVSNAQNDVISKLADFDLPAFSNADYIQQLKDIALGVPELSQWSCDDWQALDVAFKGVSEPEHKWTHAIVYLELPPDAKAPKYCEFGWAATIVINLESMQVEEIMAPSKEKASCGYEFGGPVLEDAAVGKDFMPVPVPTVVASGTAGDDTS